MTAIAPTLQAFFTDHLIRHRQASPHTVAAYRDTFRLLLAFARDRTGRQPAELQLTDLDASLVGAFLDHLQTGRGNSVRTRNARLAAVHSLFRYASLRHPDSADVIAHVLAIPPKRADRILITYLTEPEAAALLAAPGHATRTGRRDYAMLTLAVQTGLRVSELTALTAGDVHLAAGPHVSCHGKGRKQRITPLTPATIAVLRGWLDEHRPEPGSPLFPARHGGHLSRDAVEQRLALHAKTASAACLSLQGKRLSPHTLRHTAAMRLLAAGVDITVIALWLGHENTATTQIYIHADLALKEQALARTSPQDTPPGRYQPPDHVLAFLESL